MTPTGKRFESLFQEMDSLFQHFYEWLAGQYDAASGGFYYARSSFDMDHFKPDIESTAQALNILIRSGLLESMPSSVRERMISFLQQKQDPATGYFYDADPNMHFDEVMVFRALGYSVGSLSKLGGRPLHKLPHEAQERPSYLESPDAYVAWLKSVDLRNSWRGCDFMGAPNHHLARMSEEERRPYVEAGRQYFASIQDPETGLWGGGNRYIRISGTFKLRAFYDRFHIPVPHVDRIYRTLLDCLRNDEAIDMCWVRNPMDLLGAFQHELVIPERELTEILEITIANMRRLLREDGGFSRELKHSPPAPNVAQVKEGEFYPYMPKPVRIGKGLVEGDMNAGTQALLIREISRKLTGVPHRPLTEYTQSFWEHVRLNDKEK
jgi:hypothetical protein